jgi:putative transposase
MPARNSRKTYLTNGYYHLYNRGVEKRTIFLEEQDYKVFLNYLKQYLLPKPTVELQEKLANPETNYKEKAALLSLIRLNNFSENLKLLVYGLMPNHFHLEVNQNDPETIDIFMNSLCTRYTMYFNAKYKRVGPLFQGVYKAVEVTSEPQLLELSRYIHKQTLVLENQPSSYEDYVGQRHTDWLHPEIILDYFSTTRPEMSYEYFINGDHDIGNIDKIILE